MRPLTDEEQTAFYNLQYVLDLSGFRCNYAYDIIGIQSTAIYAMRKTPGIKKAMMDRLLDMTECLKQELEKGISPASIDRTNEKKQLQEIFDNYIINKYKK